MIKKIFHSFLVGMLIFSSFGQISASSSWVTTEIPEEHQDTSILLTPSEWQDTGSSFWETTETSLDASPIPLPPEWQDTGSSFWEIAKNPEEASLDSSFISLLPEEQENISLQSDFSFPFSENSFLETFSFPEIALFSSISSTSSLFITEVYRLGNNERLEITNIDENDFVGNLTLNGVKSASYTLKNITIPAYTSVIITDNSMVGISNTNVIIQSNAGLNFPDTNPINVELLSDGTLLDTFNVDSTTIAEYRLTTPRPSFEKFYHNGTREIWNSLPSRNFNIEGFTANPGQLYILWTLTPRKGAGPIIPTHQLIISEVYYDDYEDDERWDYFYDEERIEIFNIGTGDFQGNLTLSGQIFSGNFTSYTYQNLFIPANDFLILANTSTVFQNSNGIIVNSDQSFPDFDIADNQELFIELREDNQLVDIFSAEKSWVEHRDDMNTSFQKVILPTTTLVTNAMEHTENNKKGYRTNPWIVITTSDDDLSDYSIPKKEKPNSTQNPLCASAFTELVTLTEVFRGNDRYDPYIELFIHEDMEYDYDFLLFSGSLLQASFSLDLDEETESYDRTLLEKNTRLIVTKNVGNLSEAWLLTIVYHPDFDLNNFAWELEIYGINGQDRQLLDTVSLVSGNLWKSTYNDWLVRRCGDSMDKVDEFSPGFGQEVLYYFSPSSDFNIQTIETVKYVGWWWGGSFSCPDTTPLTKGGAEWNEAGGSSEDGFPLSGETPQISGEGGSEQDIRTSPTPPSEGGYGTIKILSIEPKNPESITLQSFLSYDIDFSKRALYLKTSTSSTKKYIDGTLSANSIDTFTKNFGFLDAWACVSLYSGDILLDEQCYSTEKASTEKTQKQTFNPSLYTLKILDIDYDPEGSDTNNETITIQSSSSTSLDLSQLRLKVNTTNKTLSGIIAPGETLTITKTFGFPNSTKDGEDVVVSLFYDTYIFDTYTYNPNTPKVEAQSWTVKVFSVLDGDTFRFRKEDGTLQSVRLLWVDAPESSTTRYRTTECFGQESKTYLTDLIRNKNVRLEYDETQQQVDVYGRLIAYVYLDDALVNEKILSDGYAKEYTYKTAYTFQQQFQKAEQQAKTTSQGLRNASTCWISIEEVPEVWGTDYDKLSIKITDILYDPEGSDNEKEEIRLSIESSALPNLAGIDFSDSFKITIFPRGEYATGSTSNKSLESFWFLPLSSEILLKGSFSLPNSRATCVALKYKEYTFDTYCYNPGMEEIALSGEVLAPNSDLPNIKILSLLPNPSGADAGKEEISLLRNPPEKSA